MNTCKDTLLPCTLCNSQLKWPLLAQLADERGIYHIATGHYVQKVQIGDTCFITHATDADKDQSFFLWGLKQDILQRMLLPMGTLTKQEARQWAAQHGFQKVATKKDSIGVCFCPMDYRSFLKKRLEEEGTPMERGRFLDEEGHFIAWHEGYPFYTIGQRRGLGIDLNRAVFVKDIHVGTNEVVLASLAALEKREMWLKDWNLVDEARVLNQLSSSRYATESRKTTLWLPLHLIICFMCNCRNRWRLLHPVRRLLSIKTDCCWAVESL